MSAYDQVSQQREWLYYDGSTQKGPISSSLILRLLEKGILLPTTIIWKNGMESWKSLSEINEFKDKALFYSKQWYYVDSELQQKGPIITKYLIDKIKNGDIDGMTLVYSDDTNGWKKISDIDSLRQTMLKISQEEEIINNALASISNNPTDQTFSEDRIDIPTIPEHLPKKKNIADGKKSFLADNGKRYKWDDDEQDWVEDSDTESENDDENNQDDSDDDSNSSDNDDQNHEPKKHKINMNTNTIDKPSNSIKKKRKKRSKKGPNTWVYITGLPSNITEDEVRSHFSKVGLIALNPMDQTPRIKIYRDEYGQAKGDALLCYNAQESVQLAIDILNEGYIRPNHMISVSLADFKSFQDKYDDNANNIPKKRSRSTITQTQWKIAQSAMKQALAWNEDDDTGLVKVKALKIIVLEGMFHPNDFLNDSNFGQELEEDLATECSKYGEIDKLTIFSKHPSGIVIVKYKTSFAAQECIRVMDGRYFGGKKIKCHYWDGVTNYSLVNDDSHQSEDQEKQRLDEFGDWLEQQQQDLPMELRLRVESDK